MVVGASVVVRRSLGSDWFDLVVILWVVEKGWQGVEMWKRSRGDQQILIDRSRKQESVNEVK